jgi:pSer/pThr/pTyr-binding forkhead associated (FHA) protein
MLFSYTSLYNLTTRNYLCFISHAEQSYLIGRNAGSLASPSRISREHIKISKRNNKLYIMDLGSLNKTSINGRELKPYTEYQLTVNDLIMLPGNIILVTDNPRFDPEKIKAVSNAELDNHSENIWERIPSLLRKSKATYKIKAVDENYNIYQKDIMMDELIKLYLFHEYDALAKKCHELLEVYPEEHEVLNLQHHALTELGGDENKLKAIQCLKQAIKLAPEIVGYQENLAHS